MSQGRPSSDSDLPDGGQTLRRFPGDHAPVSPAPWGQDRYPPRSDTAVSTPPGSGLTPGTPSTPDSGDGGIYERGEVILEPGQVIFERYRVLRTLGEGGMGAVWLVLDIELDAERALKMINHRSALDPSARDRFRREAKVMAKFNHPNAVTIYTSKLDRQDVGYLVMEYAPGKSLDKVLKRGQPMPLKWTANLLHQLADVLQVAHDKGIVHRDLKPSNLILIDGPRGQQQLKVLDFGIAKILKGDANSPSPDSDTKTGLFLGTPLYSGPEQIYGHAECRSDLYAVGIILYECLTGFRPFSGRTDEIVFNTVNSSPPPFRTINPQVNIPPAIEQVVMKCLAKRPEDRPENAAALSDMFRNACALGVSSVVRPRRKVPFKILAGAGLICLAAAVVGLMAYNEVHSKIGWTPVTVVPVTPPPDPKPDDGHEVVTLDGRKFVLWKNGVYLPATYSVENPNDLVEGWPRRLTREDGVQFIRIPRGTFPMGTKSGAEDDMDDNTPVHDVTLSGYYIQECEVTNREMLAFHQAHKGRLNDPSTLDKWGERFEQLKQALGADKAGQHPAVCVPWLAASEFAKVHMARLPTEAQWEYAARSGGSDVLVWPLEDDKKKLARDLANIDRDGASNDVWTEPVGSFKSDRTRQGVFDMIGNVREWSRDVYNKYGPESATDPRFPPDLNNIDAEIILRGGAFNQPIESRFCTNRGTKLHLIESQPLPPNVGFRLVIECPPVDASPIAP